MKSLLAIVALIFGAACGLAQASNHPTGPSQGQTQWWSHVRVLADDRMEGRFTGSAGYHRAASYVAEQFRAMGLAPAARTGFFQPVRLRGQRTLGDRSSLVLASGQARRPLAIGEDAILGNRIPQPRSIDAPLIFIGYGLHMPEAGYDDFSGRNLRGAILVAINGGPANVSAALKSHARAAETWSAVERAGAIGLITIPNPSTNDIPWERRMILARQEGMYLADPTLRDAVGEKFTAMVNPARAEILFANSGRRFAELLADADEGRPLPRFAMNARLQGSIATETRDLESPNVVAIRPGSDPQLRDEYVVLTAHLDHLGKDEGIDGDAIYNGAMDNAAGVASMLVVARRLSDMPVPPRRSIVFLAVTAEERGLLGSRSFAHDPVVPRGRIAANINVDMFLPIFGSNHLIIHGVDESTLGENARATAAALGFEIAPDPAPDRNSFIRSDQYSFIRNGIPALSLKMGYLRGSSQEAVQREWLRTRYHAPSDDVDQPVALDVAERFNAYFLTLVRSVADDRSRPQWLDDSFFRRFARPSPSRTPEEGL